MSKNDLIQCQIFAWNQEAHLEAYGYKILRMSLE